MDPNGKNGLLIKMYLYAEQVCQKSYGTLKELSIHLAETGHFEAKQFASSSPEVLTDQPQSLTTGEKKKKSLPVRKLLEMERGIEGNYFLPLVSGNEEDKQQQVILIALEKVYITNHRTQRN